MNSKKIGLCSVNYEYTLACAEKLHAKTGIGFIVFAEIAGDYISENYDLVNSSKDKNLKRVILPTFQLIRRKYVEAQIVVLDMEVLVHEEAVSELKKDFSLVVLEAQQPSTGIENIMYKEYSALLDKIADIKVKKIEEVI